MSWKVKAGPDGLPVWSGVDSIIDPWHQNQWNRWWCSRGCLGLILIWCGMAAPLLFFLAYLAATEWREADQVPLLLGIGAMAAFVFWMLLSCVDWSAPKQFITRNWTLTGSARGLSYEASAFSAPLDPQEVSRDSHWSVGLDDVARVETGLTREWQPSRRYEGGPIGTKGRHEVPPAEFQTFLFLSDGSRRVCLTANAERESAVTLAHSMRSWVEARKAEVRSAMPLADAVQSGIEAAPTREGFDI